MVTGDLGALGLLARRNVAQLVFEFEQEPVPIPHLHMVGCTAEGITKILGLAWAKHVIRTQCSRERINVNNSSLRTVPAHYAR